MDREELKKIMRELIKSEFSSGSFTAEKLTDLPTDALQVTSRRFVTLNGNTANRPRGSVVGQFYLDTQINKPVWWSGSTFIDSSGNPA